MPVPHDRPTFSQIVHALRVSGESGDILCAHAAEEIERLTLTGPERRAVALGVEQLLSMPVAADREAAHLLAVMLERVRS
jgi:hypothetical protein